MATRLRWRLGVWLVGLAGCGDAGEGLGDAAAAEVGADAGVDAGRDASGDAGVDAGRDASGDAGVDAGRDASADAGVDAGRDASADAGVDAAMPAAGVAPRGLVAGEELLRVGATPVALSGAAPRVFRIDASPRSHWYFLLRFAPERAQVVLAVDRFDGARAAPLGQTDAGRGLRTLSVFDPSGPRTFWVRVLPGAGLSSATLTLTETPFADGSRCVDDCARLLQMPLANDPRRDGYTTDSATVFRYWFGRRDLVMFVRHAGQSMAARGAAPFVPQDFSQWDGATPGADVGALRHASHQRGKDVDLSLYGTDGAAPWRSYCVVRQGSDGRECAPGTVRGFDAAANVPFFADFFATERVTMCFLDRELIGAMRPAARAAMLPSAVAAQFSDGVHLQHWPNHDNHIHVRVSEASSQGAALAYEPFEAP
ncbi:MAG: hypothetical protein JNK72_09005 [Myxococcales bacterium]|nr:hypothetical protein [Myxococcales bacterium]